MDVYTWDFKSILNFAPLSGEAKVSYSAKGKPGLPHWARGLAVRQGRPVPRRELQAIDPKLAASFGYEGAVETTDSLLPAAGAWADAVYDALDKRYPHNPEYGPGFFYYDTPTDVRLIYDPGVDMHREWQKIFGKTAPMFTNCRRAKPSFRPWTARNSTSPLVFFDGQRDDWALTDTLGAPYFARASVQTSIDFMYVVGMEDIEVFLPAVRKELGEAIRAWRCPVHPKDVLGR